MSAVKVFRRGNLTLCSIWQGIDQPGYSFTSFELNVKWSKLFVAPLSIPDVVTVNRLTLGHYEINPDNHIRVIA